MTNSAKPKAEGNMTTLAERVTYGTYFIGQNLFYVLVLTFLTVYFTDIGIPAMSVAAIALVVKVWDAINDPIFGGIVDKVRFKKGKFLPWVRISVIVIPLATIFMFAIPSDLSLGVKIAWAVIAYMLWDTAYTLCDVPIFGLVPVMTGNVNERTTLMSIGRVCAMVAAIIISILVPGFREAIGGWLPTVIVLTIIAFITMIPICVTAKERVKPITSEQEVSAKEMFKFIFSNKYMLFFYGALIISYSSNIAMTLSMFVARSCFGDESLAMMLQLIGILPAIIIGMLMPMLAKRIDKFLLFFWSNVISALLGFVIFFAGFGNLTLFMVLSFIRGIPGGFIIILMFMFTPDFVEYGTYKTGINASGVAFSLQTFSTKFMSAIATALGALLLGIIGFVEGEGAIQAAGFENNLWIIYTLVPAIGALVSLPLLTKYKLRDKHIRIMAECNEGRITAEEAKKVLGDI